MASFSAATPVPTPVPHHTRSAGCDVPPPPRDAWSCPSGPPPPLVDTENALMGLGARHAKGGTSAPVVPPSRHLPTRLDPTDQLCTRGLHHRCVYAPDRMSSEFAPPLPTPVFVAGTFTRPRYDAVYRR